MGTLAGEKAFNHLLSLKGGEFQLKPFKAPPQRTVQSNWEVLLLGAARCSDEDTAFITKKSAEASAVPPAPGSPPTEPPKVSPATDDKHAVLGDDIVVVATYDGKWKPADDSKK